MTLKYKFTFLLLASSLLGFAQDQLHLKGKITGLADQSKLLIIADHQQHEVVLKEGVVDMRLTLEDAPSSVYLLLPDYEYMQTSLFVGNEEVLLNGSIEDFPSKLRAENSKYDDLRYKHYLLNKSLNEQKDNLADEAEEQLEEGIDMETVKRIYFNESEPYGKITLVEKQIAENDYLFLKENINTYYGQFLLGFSIDKYTNEQLETLISLVNSDFKNSDETKFIQTLASFPDMKEGDNYYDFSALNKSGESIKFADFFKDKYVLLEFVDPNCGYCAMAAPEVEEMQKQLGEKLTKVAYYTGSNDKDIEILEDWGYQPENIVWNRNEELNEVLAKYRSNTTPNYFLFSPEGKLLLHNEGRILKIKDKLESFMQ